MISYYAEAVKLPIFKHRPMSTWVRSVAQLHGYKVGELAYIFCNDAKILSVNQQYLQHDYYTDIITFDYTEGFTIAGDLFISLDTVRTNAQLQGTLYEEELCRVIIHGVLHLCGIDDKAPGARAIMEAAENEALAMRPSLLLPRTQG